MEKTVLAFGSFDLFHPGHLHYLKGASRYGKLTVVVARDSSILKLKGRKALMDEESRLEIVKSLRLVHSAVLGQRIERWDDAFKILLRFRPDYIALGYDQKVNLHYLKKFIKDNGLNSKVVRIGAYRSGTFKSSKLKKLISEY